MGLPPTGPHTASHHQKGMGDLDDSSSTTSMDSLDAHFDADKIEGQGYKEKPPSMVTNPGYDDGFQGSETASDMPKEMEGKREKRKKVDHGARKDKEGFIWQHDETS